MTQAKQASALPVEVTSMTPADKNFVHSAWKKSHRQAPKQAQLPSNVYYGRANPEIDDLIEHSNVLVLRDAEKPDFLYGFIVYELGNDAICVHFTYIKRDWRRYGLAKKLLVAVVRAADRAGLDVDSSNLLYTHESRFNAVAQRLDFTYVNPYRWARNHRIIK
jgi:GNAT superfamily N-acetyltransferase